MNENAANDKFLRQWIFLCEDKLERLKKLSANSEKVENSPKIDTNSPKKVENESTIAEKLPTKSENLPKTDIKVPTTVEKSIQDLPLQSPTTDKSCSEKSVEREKPKLSHDWYQTETSVVVEVRAKGLKADDVIVEFSETGLAVNIKLDGGREYVLDLHLAHPIVHEQVIIE